MLKAPKFWWQKKSIASFLLSGFSWVYEFVANKKFKRPALYFINCPVLCIGNFTLGGNGKTPLARNIAEQVKKFGLNPVILMRGYKGSIKKACLVTNRNNILEIGDEAMLLSQNCNVIVAPKREEAISLIYENNFNFVILDDGFQSRKINYNYSLIAIDAYRSFGNGCVFPSGPLRANLALQLQHTDAIVAIGEQNIKIQNYEAKFYKAKSKSFIVKNLNTTLAKRNIFAFCAIGNANKFYATLQQVKANIVIFKDFADHHKFTDLQLNKIIKEAKEKNLELVTTAKDYVKIKDKIQNIWVLDIDIEFKNNAAIDEIINNTILAYKAANLLRNEASQSL